MTKNDINGTLKLDRSLNYQWVWYSAYYKEWITEQWLYTKEVMDAIKEQGTVFFDLQRKRRLELYDGELIIQDGSGGWHWLDTEDMDYDY
jgi:hypothetical protein